MESSCCTDKTIWIGRNLLQEDLLFEYCFTKRCLIISDNKVAALYGNQLGEKLGAEVFEVPIGEQGKTRAVKELIEDQMLAKGYGRETVVIGLGGGAITDLAGFIASTYLRGVSLILIPTTLLAMVDAAIGGKNGVNTPRGKNLIGTIYQPELILSDLDVLKTLPEKEMQNGFSEIYKMGLISDPSIFETAELDELVVKAAEAKIAIAQQDPTEKGLRRVLNFGHTIAHGLEAISDFTFPHGEAVAIGCVTESYLSFQLGYLSKNDYEQIEELYQSRFRFLHLPHSYERGSLLKALAFDKKKSASGVRFVLIDQIGRALPFEGQYCRTVEDKDLAAALAKMEQLYG